MFKFLVLLPILAILNYCLYGSETKPHFHDHSIKVYSLKSPDELVENRAAIDITAPFSWDQTIVTRQGNIVAYAVDGFDPNFNSVTIVKEVLPQIVPFNIDPNNFDFAAVKVLDYNRFNRLLALSVPSQVNTQFVDTLNYRVEVNGRSDNRLYPLNVDTRGLADNSPLRGRPSLLRSPGSVVPPGNLVRLRWSSRVSSLEKFPQFRFEFSGRTGAATDMVAEPDIITTYQSLKVRPLVRGHYVCLVAPWDTLQSGALKQRGTTSNGAVFLCGLGSENLPPVTDGLRASTFYPVLDEMVTGIEPVATDPDTGVTNETGLMPLTVNFGDGTGLQPFTSSHVFAEPGIYKASVTIPDLPLTVPMTPAGADGLAEDIFVVNGTAVGAIGSEPKTPSVAFTLNKQITPDEGGNGVRNKDRFTLVWRGPEFETSEGDQIVFCFNRNRYGAMHTDPVEEPRFVLNKNRVYSARLADGTLVNIRGARNVLTIKIDKAKLDRTGDPRLGGADIVRDCHDQLIAVCIIPAGYQASVSDRNDIRVFYMRKTDVLKTTLVGGNFKRNTEPETAVKATAAKGFRLTLEINDETLGLVDLDPLGPFYAKGRTVKLLARRAKGKKFNGYTGDLVKPKPKASLKMDGDKQVTARFSN